MRTLRLLPRVDRRSTLALAVVIVAGGLFPAALILAAGVLLGGIAGTVSQGLQSPAGERSLVALAVIGAALVGSETMGRLNGALAASLGSALNTDLQQRVIQAMNRPAGIRHLDDPAIQDLVSRSVGVGVGGLTPGDAVQGLAGKATTFVQGFAAAGILVPYHWWLPILLLAAQLWRGRVDRQEWLQQSAEVTEHTRLVRRSSYFRDLALTGGAAKEIRLFGLAGWVVDCFRAEWASAMERIWRDRGRRRVLSTTVLLVASAANFGAYALLGVDAVHGVIGLGALAASLYAVHQVWYVARLTPLEPHIAYGMSAVPAVLELEQTIARQQEPSGRQPAEDAPRAAIEFHNVSFAYPGSSASVLDRLDLVIPAGRSMAVVGANGAGKTTLVKLLCRLYDPDQGSITVDGSDLEELDAGAWQRRLAAIFQDFTRFELSARENVALGTEGRRAGSEALERAAARAGVLERVRALPKGWDTPLTRHLDFGADLSGGEWQRIALARALYAVEAGARVLILDEPTASLDVRAEAAFYDRFLELTRGLTTILISHRFSTVRRADLICVLDHGRVAELGSHDELMARGARYASLFTLQSAHFLDDAGLEEEPV